MKSMWPEILTIVLFSGCMIIVSLVMQGCATHNDELEFGKSAFFADVYEDLEDE